MPIESTLLRFEPVPVKTCPACKAKFEPFMRGTVQRSRFAWWIGPTRPYCALICSECKNIVGYEQPSERYMTKADDWKDRGAKLAIAMVVLAIAMVFAVEVLRHFL